MKGFILGIAASAIAFVILLNVLPASMIEFKGDNLQLALLAGAVGVVNAVIKPIVKILSFPISLMTLGLAGLVINAGLLLGVAFLADSLANLNFTIGGFPAGGITSDTIVGAVVVSVLLGILSAVVGLVVKD
ncbi:MAG: phage holin family protein [Candidatus Limnocylindrales bacterium]